MNKKNRFTLNRYYSNIKLPNTEKAAFNTLCIPLHQGLKQDDVSYIIETIKKFK